MDNASLRNWSRNAATHPLLRFSARELLPPSVDPSLLEDRYSNRVRREAERKLSRDQDVVEVPAAEEEEDQGEAGDVDLLETIRRSIRREEDGQTQRSDGKRRRGEKLESKSKDELYHRAQQLDLPGRSRMNKSQLVEALRAREERS